MSVKILVINPGSTSTKIGVFEDTTLLFDETLRHSTEEIAKYPTVIDQKDFRKDIIVSFLKEKNFDIKSLNLIVGRGGLLKPIPGGTYEVTDDLIADLKSCVRGEHASNLGGILAREIADEIGVKSYIVDPVVVDEMEEVARLSGLPDVPRTSIFHALNQKAVAKRYAAETGKAYEDLNLIVVHLGGGVSVGPHKNGKVIDIFNALDGDGAFSPERAGSVPSGGLVKLCYSGKYTEKEMMKNLIGKQVVLMLTSELTICVKLISLLNQAMKRQSLYVKLSFTTFQRTSVQWQPFFAEKLTRLSLPAVSHTMNG